MLICQSVSNSKREEMHINDCAKCRQKCPPSLLPPFPMVDLFNPLWFNLSFSKILQSFAHLFTVLLVDTFYHLISLEGKILHSSATYILFNNHCRMLPEAILKKLRHLSFPISSTSPMPSRKLKAKMRIFALVITQPEDTR